MSRKDSPWRYATTFVSGYEGVQIDRRFEDKKLQNLCRMLNDKPELRKSFLTQKSPSMNWFVSSADAKRYMTQDFQKRKKSGPEQTIAETFLRSLPLEKELVCMLEYDVFIDKSPFYFCKDCKEYGIGTKCYKKGSHKVKIIKTYALSDFSFDFWYKNPDKFLEGMCYFSLLDLRLPNVKIEPCWAYRKKGEENIFGEIDVLMTLQSNVNLRLSSTFSGFNNRYIAILASTSIVPKEKEQVNKLFNFKIPCIFVTTEKSIVFEDKCIKTFTKVDSSTAFPREFVKYVESILK